MNNLINETNAKKVIDFLKIQVKCLSYTQKTDKIYERKIIAVERRYRRDNFFTKEKRDAEIQKIKDWYVESKEYIDKKSDYLLYNNFKFNDQTVLTIIYNRLRRGDKRPHTGSIEKDNEFLNGNSYEVGKIETYIKKRFPIQNVSESVEENVWKRCILWLINQS